MKSKEPCLISISEIFNKFKYEIPIYQRNFAWTDNQIEQLINDIDSSINNENEYYFLGNLIVNAKSENLYEVIDGQQRLTVLFLLKKYLKLETPIDALKFEARTKSNSTLEFIGCDHKKQCVESPAEEILSGYNEIKRCFEDKLKHKKDFKLKFEEKLGKVFLIQIQVPKGINLNHYFEIMNTRGEQLELHEIVKNKLISKLQNEVEREVAAMIWEKCSDMNSYVQMNFDINDRRNIFDKYWSSLKEEINSFDSLVDSLNKSNTSWKSRKKSLRDILINIDKIYKETASINESNVKNEENERFESIISFPDFLLQVNLIVKNDAGDGSSLDDRHFINKLQWTWDNTETSKNFLFNLLRCQVFFDKYILKREFAKEYKEKGKWSLQRLQKSKSTRKKDSEKPSYVGTFSDEENQKLRMLQSCLRITYTSPKTMYWINEVLSKLLNNEETKQMANDEEKIAKELISLLEKYCVEKVRESDFEQKSGFNFERIVFSYLDYLLYRDGYPKGDKKISGNWQFQFRNSIEHFYPQNPAYGKKWNSNQQEKEALNSFGNLALISVSGNSTFSNQPPQDKVAPIEKHKKIVEQSLKLQIMKKMVEENNNEWTPKMVETHKEEMFNILKEEILEKGAQNTEN